MSIIRYSAQLDENNVVTQVIVATPEEAAVHGGTWLETWHGSGGTALHRKNMATRGMIYDKDRDAFYHPQPYPSWILDENTCNWEPPVPMPTTGMWWWHEDIKNWTDVDPEK